MCNYLSSVEENRKLIFNERGCERYLSVCKRCMTKTDYLSLRIMVANRKRNR